MGESASAAFKWNVEQLGFDITSAPWVCLPTLHVDMEKVSQSELEAVRDILRMRAADDGKGKISKLDNGSQPHEMPDHDVPHTYFYKSSSSNKRPKKWTKELRLSLKLKSQGGGSFKETDPPDPDDG